MPLCTPVRSTDAPTAHLFPSHRCSDVTNSCEQDVVIVSPDVGGAKRAEAMASSLKTGLAIFSKKRASAGLIDKMVLVGEVGVSEWVHTLKLDLSGCVGGRKKVCDA